MAVDADVVDVVVVVTIVNGVMGVTQQHFLVWTKYKKRKNYWSCSSMAMTMMGNGELSARSK
jgi:hypothetical protein